MNTCKLSGIALVQLVLLLVWSAPGSAQAYEESIVFQRISDGKILMEKNANKALIPASVTKLATAGAVLDYWTPYFQFETKIYYTGSFKDGIVSGDLVVVGSGDPFIVSEKLWELVADLKAIGLKEVKGHILIDNSIFDGRHRDASRSGSRNVSSNAYDAPLSAFGVNFNTINITVAPGYNQNQPALVNTYPYPISNVEIQNKVKTTGGGSDKVKVIRKADKKRKRTLVSAQGHIGHSASLTKIYRSVDDPLITSGEILKSFLVENNIRVNGKVDAYEKPTKRRELYILKGYPVTKLVNGLNTFSNNFIADMLIKSLGAHSNKLAKGTGSYQNGLEKINEFLTKKVGIDAGYVIENGSGLSANNRLSSSQVVQLLTYMSQRLDLFPEFLAALPASGWSGTLEKRFKMAGLDAGLVRAKTGTLTSPVSAVGLAGYIQTKKHGLVAFSIITNGIKNKEQPSVAWIRDKQDAMVASYLQ